MRRTLLDYGPDDSRNIREFVAFAATSWAKSETELAERCGLSQAMISSVMAGTRGTGIRSLRALSAATSISTEDISSGVGLLKLRARMSSPTGNANDEGRLRAARALAELFGLPITETMSIFDELGVSLPIEVPASTWFDVGRSALERRAAGRAVTKRL